MSFSPLFARATLIVVALAVFLNDLPPVGAQAARIDAGPALQCLVFSPDSRFLATAGSGNELKIWDIQSLGLSHRILLPTEPSEDRKSRAKLMEREGKPEHLRNVFLHGVVRGLSYSPDGSVLAALADDPPLDVYACVAVFLCDPARESATRPVTIVIDPFTKGQVPLKQVPPLLGGGGFFGAPCYSVAFSSQGDRVFTAVGQVRMWDKDGNLVRSFRGLTGSPISFAACPSRNRLAVAEEGGMFRVLDDTGRLHYRYQSKRKWSPEAIAFSSDGRYVAFGEDTRIGLIDLHAGRRIRDLRPKGKSWPITCLAFSPDGKLIASSTVDSSITLWDVANRSVAETFPAQGGVTALAFSPDGKTLACARWDGVVLLHPVNPAHRR